MSEPPGSGDAAVNQADQPFIGHPSGGATIFMSDGVQPSSDDDDGGGEPSPGHCVRPTMSPSRSGSRLHGARHPLTPSVSDDSGADHEEDEAAARGQSPHRRARRGNVRDSDRRSSRPPSKTRKVSYPRQRSLGPNGKQGRIWGANVRMLVVSQWWAYISYKLSSRVGPCVSRQRMRQPAWLYGRRYPSRGMT